MGSIAGKLGIGKKKSSSSSSGYTMPYFKNTGFSSVDGTTLTLDPSIRAIQDKALGNYGSIYGDIGNATNNFLGQTEGLRSRTAGQISDLRNRYLGNQGAYMTARTNPIMERFAALRGRVSSDLTRRGIGGSSFGYGTLRDLDTQAGRELGDARALATQEAAGFESGLTKDLANFEKTLNDQELQALNTKAQQQAAITGETVQIARLRLLQELQALGLGQSQVGNVQTTQKDFSLGLNSDNLFGGGTG